MPSGASGNSTHGITRYCASHCPTYLVRGCFSRAHGRPRHKLPALETEKYIDKVTEPEDRFELYCEVSMWKKAADTAVKLKDPARLQEVARLARDPKVTAYCQDLAAGGGLR